MVNKHVSRSAVGGLRIWREKVNEVQDPVAPRPTRLIPQPVRQNTGSGRQTQRGDEAHLPGSCERPGRKLKTRRRHGQAYLTRKDGSKQYGVAMPYNELNHSIHRF
jgi:hypothetical protein